jgi:hypothetical protein
VPMGKTIESYPLDEWERMDRDLYKLLFKKLENWKNLYGLPPPPDLDAPIDCLHTEIDRFIAHHAWFADERAYSALAHWGTCTWLQDQLSFSMRLILNGAMRSGKSRALRTLASISYRPVMSPDASGAAMYRLNRAVSPHTFH